MSNPQKPSNPNNYKILAPPPLEAYTPEWALFRFLSEWNSEDLQIAIKKDIDVDLSTFTNTIVDYATTEILKKFETYRPDLHKTLSSKEGKTWLKKKIRQALTQT